MCTAFQRVLTRYPYHKSLKSFQNTTKKNYKQKSLETTNCDSSDYCVKEKKKPPHQCGSHAKWKLRKRKHLHFFFGILYFSYGLWSWLFPSSTLNLGILFPFPVTVSAIVTPEQKNFFNVDLYKPQESSQEFLENFGPGTFSSSEDAASDEANDAQLYLDMVQSIQIWQRNKQMRHKRVKRDEAVVCYSEELGCFRDDGFFDYLDMLPSPPEEINTAMMLFTRQNFEKAQFIEYNNISSVQESHYNATLDTKIIIHGFGSSCNRVWAREMRLSFLAVEDVNVICVDWSAGAADPNYVRAAVNTRLVGKQVSILVEKINESIGKSITQRTHIVGFSLGAHVAGFAGSHLKNLSRITGLDPAGPLFEGYDGKVRLDKNDADYVDVIHSNGESVIVGGFGTWEPIGHVDFYPNGGRAQRGCQHFLVGGLYDFIYSYQGNDTSTYRYLCNHRRAYKFFTDSISPKCYFTSFPCENYDKFQAGECFDCNKGQECGRLGYYSNQAKGRGSLYMLTRDEEPFCGTQYMVNILFSRSRGPVQTYGKLQLMLVDKNGINETFTVTKDVDDLMTSGTKIEKIISVHPVIEPVTAYLLYVAYDGWIFSGRLVWRVDKISLREGRTGAYLSHCKSNEAETVLRSGIPAEFDLMTGDCNVPPIGLDYFLPPYNTKFPKKPKPVTHPDHFPVLQHITNEPISNTLIPPPPPPPPSTPTSPPKPTLTTSKPSKPNEFTMETKIVQIAASGEDLENAIQINDEVAPASVPDTTTSKEALKKTEYTLVNAAKPDEKQDNPKVVQVWDSLAPSAVPDTIKRPYLKPKRKFVTTSIPTTSRGQQLHLYRPPTAKPESASFWPGFLDFFSGSEVKTTSMRPMPPITYHRRPLIPTTDTNKRIQEDDEKPGNMITLYSSNKNGTTQEQHVTMHHLSSDEQLTILKVDQDQNNKTDEKEPGDDDNDVNLDTTANQKSEYIVLHKLPNGEALNLENLETYSSMADVESEIKKSKPYYQPRSLLPPLIVSQRPFVTPEPYEPIPLDQLDDLEAMPDSEPPPVYIINPLKGDLNVTGEIQPPTEEEVEEAIKQANVELFKLNQTHSKGERQEKLLTAVFLQPNEDLASTTDRSISTSPQSTTKDFFEAQTVVYDFNWTPIPKRPTFGPSRAPPNYRPIKLDSVKQLSGIAQVSIPDSGAIADELRSSNSNAGGPEGPPVVNVQLLPPRLSAVLFQVNEKRRALYGRYPPGFHRQNKISPVFKIDPTGLNRKKSKSLDSLFREPPQPRHSSHGRRLRSNPLRRFQTQLVPGSSDPHKYIPLRVKPTHHPKLWWQPMTSTYSKVTIVNHQNPSSGLQSEEVDNTTSLTTTSEPDEDDTTTTIEPMDYTTEDEDEFDDTAEEETTTQQQPEQDEE